MFYFLQPTSSVVSEELAGSAHLAFSMLRIFPVAAKSGVRGFTLLSSFYHCYLPVLPID